MALAHRGEVQAQSRIAERSADDDGVVVGVALEAHVEQVAAGKAAASGVAGPEQLHSIHQRFFRRFALAQVHPVILRGIAGELQSAQAPAGVKVEGIQAVQTAAARIEVGDVGVANPTEEILRSRVVAVGRTTAAHRIVVIAVLDVLAAADDAAQLGVPEVGVVEAQVMPELMASRRRAPIAVGQVEAHAADESQPGVACRRPGRGADVSEVILGEVITVARRGHNFRGGVQLAQSRVVIIGDQTRQQHGRSDVRTFAQRRQHQFSVGHLEHVVAEILEVRQGVVGGHPAGVVRPDRPHEKHALAAFRVT